MKKEMKKEILAAIPNNWTDPLLTGPESAGELPYGYKEIENLLNTIRTRIKTILDAPNGICKYYPKEKDDCVCGCGSDISGAFICTTAYASKCQWAQEKGVNK